MVRRPPKPPVSQTQKPGLQVFEPAPGDVIYDWNKIRQWPKPAHDFDFLDETLRDGVQSPSVTDPSLEHKLELLDLMESLGIGAVNIGLPGAGRRAFKDVVAQAKYIRKQGLKIQPTCAARTVVQDIAPVAEAVQASGLDICVYTFIGSSPIRQWAEEWDLDFIRKMSADAIAFARKQGLDVAYVTEDTTRTPPDSLEVLFKSAIDHGARRLVLCDTVGHATPDGVRALVTWTRELIRSLGVDVKVDWHGHNDRSLALVNAIIALESGADRIHGCGLGVGERVGNTPMDLLLLNLKLLGWYEHPLTRLVDYVRKVSEACEFPIPVNYPLSGEDAFRTGTGVHAAAIIKAQRRGNLWLADRVYSGVPAGEFGKQQIIEIGHMSGMSNVRFWLEKRGYAGDDELCQAILARAKSCAWTLTEKEILEVIAKTRGIARSRGGKASRRTVRGTKRMKRVRA